MHKILLIRFSSIGDIVLTTPVIRCLKTQLKNTEIHYLTKKKFVSLIENNPYVDKIYSIDKNTREVTKALKKEKYTHIIDLHKNLRSMRIKLLLNKNSSSYKKLNIKKWMTVNFKMNQLPDIHIVDRYMNTIHFLSVINDGKGLDYFIPQKDIVLLTELPASHQNGYIAFVIGAKHYTKQLPAEKISSICKKINQPVVLLGGKEDFEKGKEIQDSRFKIQDLVFNACGKYNLNQSSSLIRQARKVITHDTGLMHIAAAFKKEIISVWGNTVPQFGMYPYLPGEGSKIVEVKTLSCRPCSKIGYKKCPKKHFKCMMEIDESEFIFTA